LGHQRVERVDTRCVSSSDQARLGLQMAFVVVVAGRAIRKEVRRHHGEPFDFRDPLLLRFLARLRIAEAPVHHLFDDVPDVLCLIIQHRSQVHRKAVLRWPQDEAVGETAAGKTVECLQPLGPMVGQSFATDADYFEAGSPRVGRTDFEAGCEDDAINWILHAIRDNACPGNSLNTLGCAGIYQLDVGPVEGRQIFVIEGRPLAELAIPGLQSFGGGRVSDGLIDPRANTVHLLKVDYFRHYRHLALRLWADLLGLLLRVADDPDAQVAKDVGPAVADEVFLYRNAGKYVVEVFATRPLPPGLEGLRPRRIGRFVSAQVDR